MFRLVFFKIIQLTMNCISLKSYAPKIRELDKIRQNHCLRTRLAVVKKKLCKINYLFMNLFLAFNKGRQRAGGEANCQTWWAPNPNHCVNDVFVKGKKKKKGERKEIKKCLWSFIILLVQLGRKKARQFPIQMSIYNFIWQKSVKITINDMIIRRLRFY